MRGHHLHRLPTPLRSIIYLVIALILFAVLTPMMFSLGLITGIGFAISCLLACYKGVLWKDAAAVVIIALGYWITSVAAHALLPVAYASLRNQSFLAAGLILIVFLFIWWRALKLKRGGR